MQDVENLAGRTEFLRLNQNVDGGWGYFPGKQSWVEPTVYAALALARNRDGAAERAWNLLRSWQNDDGGFRPNRHPGNSTWCTALAVLLGVELNQDVSRGAHWLLETSGAESSALNRFVRRFGALPAGREVEHRGWPWRPGTTSWVEPTAFALAALRRWSAGSRPSARTLERIRTGERMLLSVRCSDGGWNYGSKGALGVDLPSYPETTALALIGLGSSAPRAAVNLARRWLSEGGASPLARAWLTIALNANGSQLSISQRPWTGNDILLCSLECLGSMPATSAFHGGTAA